MYRQHTFASFIILLIMTSLVIGVAFMLLDPIPEHYFVIACIALSGYGTAAAYYVTYKQQKQ